MIRTRLLVSPVRALIVALSCTFAAMPAVVAAQNMLTVIRASSVIDGRGKTLSNVDITIDKGKIVKIAPALAAAPATGMGAAASESEKATASARVETTVLAGEVMLSPCLRVAEF